MKNIAKLLLTITLLLFHTLPIWCQQKMSVSGLIKDDTGTHLEGAVIRVKGNYPATVSGKDGSYLVLLPAGGRYTMSVSFTGFETWTGEIDLTSNLRQDVTLRTAAVTTDEVIVSAIRAGNKAPFAYSNIDREKLISSNSAQDIPFMLALTPSLVETSESGTGLGYTGMRIRGTEGSRINVTVDGIPLNDAESQQVFWVDLPDLVSSVDNIQVQRGVGTSSNGAGAFGASVNIQSRNPSVIAGAGGEVAYGSFNTSRLMMHASTGMLANRFAMDLRFSDIRSDGYIDRSFSKNNSARINTIYRLNRTVIKTNVILGKETTGISWWGVPAEMLETDRRFNPAGLFTNDKGEVEAYENETDNYKQNHFNLSFSTQVSPLVNISAAIHYTKGSGYYEEYREDQAFSDYGLKDDTIGGVIIRNSDLIRRKWMDNDFYGAVWSLDYKSGRTGLVFGGGANQYSGNHFGKIIWMKHPGETMHNYEWYRNRGLKTEFSIYGKLNHSFSDFLNGFADLQFRTINYRLTGTDDDLLSLEQEHSYRFFNPKAGLFFTISNRSNAFISFAVAGREPTRSDFKESKGDPGATPGSETLFDTEAGYSFRSDKLNAGINLFFMWYNDQLIPTGELSDVGYPVMTNVEKSYRTGAEFSGSVRLTKRIDIKGNFTVSRNRILNFVKYYLDYNTSDWSSEYRNISLGNVNIAYSPSVTASGEVSVKISEYLSLNIFSKYTGKQYFDNTMSAERKLKPYSVTGLRVVIDKKLKKGIEFNCRINVNNLFNSMYISNGYGGFWYEDGIEKTWAYYFPQAGTNFMITTGLRF